MSDHMMTINQLAEDRDRLARENQEMQLAIFAEEGLHWFMGTPVRITVEWPDGPPGAFSTAEELRDWARRQLADLRQEP